VHISHWRRRNARGWSVVPQSVQKKRWVERDTMKKGAGRVEGDDMLLVVEKVVVGARTLPNG
jgi:hypothetical protein